MGFKGRCAVVTGAGGEHGIGRAAVLALAEKGCNVVATDLDLEGAQQTAAAAEALGVQALAVRMDVSDETSVREGMQKVLDTFGRIDILVNNAGISGHISLQDMTAEQFWKVMHVNVGGTFLCTKAVMGQMKAQKYGRIINLSSVGAKQGYSFGGPHYITSKAAILGLTKSTALELVPYGISANAVTPGMIATDIRTRNGLSPEAEEVMRQCANQPMKRAGTPEEVAAAIVFLASEEASFITAEDIDINGGAYVD